MSKYFSNRFFTAAATESAATTGNTAVKPEPTSDKLTALQSELKVKKSALRAIEDMDSPEYEAALAEIFKTNSAIKAEVANLKAEERKAEIAEANNKRIALFDDAVTAIIANNALQADKKASQADKDAAAADAAAKREAVVNALLGSTPKPAAVKAEGGESKSADRQAIVALFLSGKTHKQIEEEDGYARSTVWHAINDYKKANGLK